jgi:IS30 family transposase
MRGYTQLTREERYQIDVLMKAGQSQSEIAKMLARHKATISRELARNRGRRGYRPKQAHGWALARRCAKVRPRLSGLMWRQIEALLRLEWSPEQIAGRLQREHAVGVSHKWIYQYIYADKRSGGDLHRYLRCQKPQRKRYGMYDRRGIIPHQVSIDARPAIVAARRRFGDWEGDTLIGRSLRGALISLVERKSKYTVIKAVTPSDCRGGT